MPANQLPYAVFLMHRNNRDENYDKKLQFIKSQTAQGGRGRSPGTAPFGRPFLDSDQAHVLQYYSTFEGNEYQDTVDLYKLLLLYLNFEGWLDKVITWFRESWYIIDYSKQFDIPKTPDNRKLPIPATSSTHAYITELKAQVAQTANFPRLSRGLHMQPPRTFESVNPSNAGRSGS